MQHLLRERKRISKENPKQTNKKGRKKTCQAKPQIMTENNKVVN